MTQEERRALAEENAAAGKKDGDVTYSSGNDAPMKTKSRVVFYCEMMKYKV